MLITKILILEMFGPSQKIFTSVGLGQFFMAWVRLGRVSHLWFEFEFRKVPLKMSNFQFFPFGSKSTWVKGGLASYLLWVKSKLGLCRGRAHLYSQVKAMS